MIKAYVHDNFGYFIKCPVVTAMPSVNVVAQMLWLMQFIMSEVSSGANQLIITLTIKVLLINKDDVNKVHIVFIKLNGIYMDIIATWNNAFFEAAHAKTWLWICEKNHLINVTALQMGFLGWISKIFRVGAASQHGNS